MTTARPDGEWAQAERMLWRSVVVAVCLLFAIIAIVFSQPVTAATAVILAAAVGAINIVDHFAF